MIKKQNTQQRGIFDNLIAKVLLFFDRDKFGNKDKILFFREIGYLLKGGIALTDATKIVLESTDNYALREISREVNIYLHQGKSLAYTINRMPEYFDEGDYYVIKSGEHSGDLAKILLSLADDYGSLHDIKNKYLSALMYPMLLIIIGFVAFLGLFLFVLPNIFEIVDSFQVAHIPWSTQVLRKFSTFLIQDWKPLVLILLIVAFIIRIISATDSAKKTFFKFIIGLPLIGNMIKNFYLIKFCRYMKIMLEAGLTYTDTFKVLRDILGIGIYQKMNERILEGLNTGKTLYQNLQKESELIPTNVSALIKVGEETANIPQSLEHILQIYERELHHLIDRLSKVIEPIMLVIIGGFIVFIAFGVFGLILQIMDGVGM